MQNVYFLKHNEIQPQCYYNHTLYFFFKLLSILFHLPVSIRNRWTKWTMDCRTSWLSIINKYIYKYVLSQLNCYMSLYFEFAILSINGEDKENLILLNYDNYDYFSLFLKYHFPQCIVTSCMNTLVRSISCWSPPPFHLFSKQILFLNLHVKKLYLKEPIPSEIFGSMQNTIR